jgi:predicted nucleic acid-binding protein
VGVLGVLIGSKKAGMITLVRPLMDRLRAELDFHIKQKLYDDVLRLAGE